MADDAFSPLPKPKYLDLIQPKPLNFQQVSQDNDAEKNSQKKQAFNAHEDSQTVVVSSPATSANTPRYQEQERYQPAQGQSRLGRDIQTGDYVDVAQAARRQGLYIIGIQGTGKTGLIENLIIQDIKQNMGVCLLDPHSDLTQAVLSRLPDRRVKDVIYLDITDYRYPFGINPFVCSDPTNPFEVQKIVDQVRHIFEKLLGVSMDTQLILEYLYNCTYTLIANPGYTMADIPLLLQDGECRKKLVANVTDIDVQLFWRLHNQKKPADQINEIASTLRRVKQLLQPLSRPIVGQSTSTIDIRKVMDEGKILLVKLDTTLESITSLIGSLIIALFLNAAKSRAGLQVHKRRQFNLYADEFQRFATEDFATLLEEARKFGIATTIAHQNRAQLETSDKQAEAKLRARTLSVANLVVFKVNSKDAAELAGEFDLTPQEAWEEELEEEWIEELEKEWTEKIEDEVIDGEEPIQVYKRDIVDHLLKQGHEDERVMQFVRTYLQTLSLTAEARGRDNVSTAQKAQQAMIDLNAWLYEGMRNANNLFQPIPKSVIAAVSSFYCLLYAETGCRYRYYDTDHYTTPLPNSDYYEGAKEAKKAAEKLQMELAGIDEMLRESVLVNPPQTAQDFFARRNLLFAQSLFPRLYEDAVSKRMFYEAKNQIKYYLSDRKKSESNLTPSEYAQMLAYCNGTSKRAIEEGYATFEKFTESLQLCQYALSQHPIMTTDSGLYKPRKRTQVHYITHPRQTFTHPRIAITHPQRTYADMLNEVASQLTNLPVFTARVKIATDNGNEEHTIKTLEPERGIGRIALQERIASIRDQNIKDGYVRERAEIEAEIRTRQEQCSEPPEDEPPISRRPR